MKPSTISSWRVETVRYLPDDSARLFKVRTHCVRAFVAVAGMPSGESHFKTFCIRAPQWSPHSAFTPFFLPDGPAIEEDLYKIDPLITAQHVTNSPP